MNGRETKGVAKLLLRQRQIDGRMLGHAKVRYPGMQLANQMRVRM